jgi:hypothetical protein
MHVRAGRFFLIGMLSAALLGLAACGDSATAGPIGAPDVVVTRAPDVTLAAGTAQVAIQSPSAGATGNIDLKTHDGRLLLSAPGYPKGVDLVVFGGVGYYKTPAESTYTKLPGTLPTILPDADPWADIDLVRGTVHILSDGGAEIAGVSTIGYTLTIDPQQAIETTPVARQAAVTALLGGRTKLFMIEVWIDNLYRIRSIEVAADFTDFSGETPPTRIDGETIASDVDFVSFGVSVPPVTAPPT